MKIKNSKLSLLVIIMIICLSVIGLSMAFWVYTKVGDKANNMTSGCFNLEMTDQKDEINLGSTYPITDEEGLKLKPFSFTLKNTCTIFAHYSVNMEMLEGTTLNSKWVAVRVNNEAINTLDTYKTVNTTIDGSTESRSIAEGYLSAGDSVDYSVSFWMDEDATINDDVMNKTFKSKIVVVSEPSSYSPIQAGYDTLHDAILANEYQTTPELAKEKIANKQEVDLSNTAPIIKWIDKVGENTTKDIAKPAKSVIETYNKDTGTGDRTTQASNLTLNDTNLRLFKTKTFNSETAKYTLSNQVYVDPTTIDYSGDTKYYIQTESIYYDQNTEKLATSSGTNNITIYQVTGASKTESKSTWNNVEYDSVTYKLNLITLTETELETDNSDKGLYQATDDYGTTYYYRGNVKNNNVYFAGYYWQIIRINGDGTIRLLYNGAEKSATGLKQSINGKKYNFNSQYNDPAYVGYMYGDPDANTFDEVHNNINDSTVKTTLDEWYKANIKDNGYSDKVATVIGFCGDRTLEVGDGISNTIYSSFGAHIRYSNQTAQFTCPNIVRDLYTTSDASIGNKALTYPVGLITYDELVYAGMDYKHINRLSYVYSEQQYWTMTPSAFSTTGGRSTVWYNHNAGYFSNAVVTTYFAIRPVINLKSDVKITGGIGTANDPFVIDTNN